MLILGLGIGLLVAAAATIGVGFYMLTEARRQSSHARATLDRERSAMERERGELLDRIGVLVDRPWNVAPAAFQTAEPYVDDEPEREVLSGFDTLHLPVPE